MLITNIHVLRYLLAVYQALPSKTKQKKKILALVKSSVLEFVSEKPNADYHTLVVRFGSPCKIAETYITQMDADELLSSIRIRQAIIRGLFFMITIFLILWFSFLTISYLDFHKDMRGYAVVEIIEVERETTN